MTENAQTDLSYITEDLRPLAVPIDSVVQDPSNAMEHPIENLAAIRGSLAKYGQRKPIVVNREGNIIEAGNGTWQAAKALGWEYIATVFVEDDPTTATGYAIADNRTAQLATWNYDVLAQILQGVGDPMEVPGIDEGFMADVLEFADAMQDAETGDGVEEAKLTLKDRFVVPPFSILDTRQGYWLERKRAWVGLGIRSDESREEMEVSGSFSGTIPGYYDKKKRIEQMLGYPLSHDEFAKDYLPGMMVENSLIATTNSGGILSIFDPVMCELAYVWFCPPEGHILDPFAGGSVRGVVAAALGCRYTGIDLRTEQVTANEAQWTDLCESGALDGFDIETAPHWIAGDSRRLRELTEGTYDFIFSCPPYYDLEIYSDDPEDLSNIGSYADFIRDYRAIIRQAVEMLAEDRFACFVVGDIRDKERGGVYRNFVGDTIAAFLDAGMKLYNEAILITNYGSLPIRVGGQFERSRKLGKTHQNVLVFVKGDPYEATAACGPVEGVTLGTQLDSAQENSSPGESSDGPDEVAA